MRSRASVWGLGEYQQQRLIESILGWSGWIHTGRWENLSQQTKGPYVQHWRAARFKLDFDDLQICFTRSWLSSTNYGTQFLEQNRPDFFLIKTEYKCNVKDWWCYKYKTLIMMSFYQPQKYLSFEFIVAQLSSIRIDSMIWHRNNKKKSQYSYGTLQHKSHITMLSK